MRRRSAIYETMDRRNETYLLGSLSIIGGEYAYSVPRRKLGDIERYSKVEVGLMGPSGAVPELGAGGAVAQSVAKTPEPNRPDVCIIECRRRESGGAEPKR